MNAQEVAARLSDHAEHLRAELQSMSRYFAESKFMGDNTNRPFAHFGYLMALLGLVDVLSSCDRAQSGRDQTSRMRGFLNQYVHPGRLHEHAISVQVFRHTLMHTGGLRYLLEGTTGAAYTWNVRFEPLPAGTHYTITKADVQYQDELMASARAICQAPTDTLSFNISIPDFADDLVRSCQQFTSAMLGDPAMGSFAVREFPKIQMQKKNLRW